MMSCVLRNSGLSSIKFLCATLSHMSIGCRVILPVTFQQVHAAPHTEGTAEADHDSLQSINCAIEKFHTFTSINSDCDVVLGTKKPPVISSSSVTIRRRPGVIGRPAISARQARKSRPMLPALCGLPLPPAL